MRRRPGYWPDGQNVHRRRLLAYDLPGRPFFTFRSAEQAADEAGVAAAAVRAEQKAAAWMRERGYPVKNLTSQAVDMSEAPLGKRGRRRG